MATLEQAPQQQDASDVPSPLSSLLARVYALNWEVVFYLVVFVIAVLTRFVNLGDRVMSHDESLHVKYSDELYKLGIFKHTPLMHGPLLFHMTALNFFLFGDSDFTGRIYPAVLGVIMVLMPKLLFQRWLGRFGAMATSVLILISPMLLYHHRYIREDTPALFFTLLMAYSIFAYLDGVKPRQPRLLLLLSASTLLSLASKETTFFYVAVFGAVLTLFWLFQLAQGWRQRTLSAVSGWAIIGAVALPVIGAVSALIVTQFTQLYISLSDVTIGPLTISGDVLTMLLDLAISVPVGLVIGVVALIIFRAIWAGLLGRPVRDIVDQAGLRAKSLFKLSLAGIIIGTVAALAMTNVLTIIPPESIDRSRQVWEQYETQRSQLQPGQTAPAEPGETPPDALMGRFILWTTIIFTVLAVVVIGTVLVRFAKIPRLPWADIAIIALVALLVCGALIVLEQRSQKIPNISFENRPTPTEFNNAWLYGSWVVGVATTAGIIVLRLRTKFFEEMRRFPVFDVLIVLGTLVLPWLSALPIFLAGYPLDGSYIATPVVNASIFGTIPFLMVSLAAGLAWNPQLWTLCAATFYAIFAFFYTTIFTNIEGVPSGIVGSLGYWLAQQGVKRGNQPQYYYMLLQLPIYEYLAMIGAAFAGVVGMLGLWRFRANRIAAVEAAAVERAAFQAAQVSEAGGDSSTLETQVSAHTEFQEAPKIVAAPESEPPIESPVQAEADLDKARWRDLARLFIVSAGSAIFLRLFLSSSNGFATITLLAVAVFLALGGFAWSRAGFDTPLLGGPTRSRPRPRADEGSDSEMVPAETYQDGVPEAEQLTQIPFLGFVGVWGVLILMALTLAGEKMPWLTTHLTLPLLLLTGWYLGTLLEKVEWSSFWKSAWTLIVLVPVFIIGAVNVLSPWLLDQPLGGLARDQQLRTFTWMGAALLAGLVGYVIYTIWRQIGTRQFVRIGILGVFVLLGVLTARTAWLAAFINYDSAKEFLVYAHGAPANKTVMNYIEDISRRTTDGMNIKVAYDNLVSWPGSWYFRNYPQARFLGDTTGATGLDEYLAIVVGTENARKIEGQLGDRFEKFDLIRLWWPMQDYFDLNVARIDNAFGNPTIRQGMWEIWWNRDYTTYAKGTGDPNRLNVNQWPVADRMIFYVRKDIAAQLWDFGVGAAKVAGLPEDPFKDRRCEACAANLALDTTATQLKFPRGVTVGPDGNVYVADSQNGRVVMFDPNGAFLRQFGAPSVVEQSSEPPAPGTFREPWGVAVDQDGLIYVADTWNHRIQVLDKDGKPLRMWGKFEKADPLKIGEPDGFYGPRAIAVDAQKRVYVADTGNKRVRVYDALGNFQFDIGKSSGEGQLNEPVGLAINNQTGELFVASTWSKRVEVYSLKEGTYLRGWTIQGWYATTERTDSNNRPYLALDQTGRYVFVTDPDVSRVLVFDTNGNAVLSFGRQGAASASQFGVLGGVAASARTGQIYLADAGTSRVLRFDPNTLPGLVPPLPIQDGGRPLPPDQPKQPEAPGGRPDF